MPIFYEITAPNGKKSHLFGTCHTNDAAVNRLSKEVAEAFQESATLLVETDASSIGLVENIKFALEANKTWNDKYKKDHSTWMNDPMNLAKTVNKISKYFSWFVPRFYIKFLVNKQSPTLLAYALVVAPEANYLDKNLMNMAKNNHKKIVSLETPMSLITLLMGTSLTYKEQREIFEHMIKDHSAEEAKKKKQQLIENYLHDEIGEQFEAIENKDKNPLLDRANKAFIDDRDKAMADKLDAYFVSGKAFVAVGAAHLPGIAKIYSEKIGYTIRVITLSERIYPVLDYTSRNYSQMITTGMLLIAGSASMALSLAFAPYMLGLGVLIVSTTILALALMNTGKLIHDYVTEPVLTKEAPAVSAVRQSQGSFFRPAGEAEAAKQPSVTTFALTS